MTWTEALGIGLLISLLLFMAVKLGEISQRNKEQLRMLAILYEQLRINNNEIKTTVDGREYKKSVPLIGENENTNIHTTLRLSEQIALTVSSTASNDRSGDATL